VADPLNITEVLIMSEQAENQEVEAKVKPEPKEIIRGRMPVAVVYLARFGAVAALGTKAAADALGTTVGKVDDIRKNRNFAYVTAEFKPTAAQVQDGIDWLNRHPVGAADLVAELSSLPIASEEDSAAFEAARAAARGQSPKTAEGEVADAGGGNRKKGGKKAKKAVDEVSSDTEASGDALLA
jgi:hypothetical protein